MYSIIKYLDKYDYFSFKLDPKLKEKLDKFQEICLIRKNIKYLNYLLRYNPKLLNIIINNYCDEFKDIIVPFEILDIVISIGDNIFIPFKRISRDICLNLKDASLNIDNVIVHLFIREYRITIDLGIPFNTI